MARERRNSSAPGRLPAGSSPIRRPGSAQGWAGGQSQDRSVMMAQRAWPLRGHPAGAGTAMITSRAVARHYRIVSACRRNPQITTS